MGASAKFSELVLGESMKKPASLNGAEQKATGQKQNRCQAKGCVRLGSVKFVGQWSYFMCPEHFRLLSDADKKYIAKTQGTQSE
jgi:hypothetical protein